VGLAGNSRCVRQRTRVCRRRAELVQGRISGASLGTPTIAWCGAFRRLVVRYERLTSMYLAFFHFASAIIALR